MPGNTLGHTFRLATFGESHGQAIGGIIDGCPAGLSIDPGFIRNELDRRRPSVAGTTARHETDEVAFLSGTRDGITLGTPIAFTVMNTAQNNSGYEGLEDIYRPSHADYTYEMKYGVRDYRGGGRASGRETVARVVGGAVAKLLLQRIGVRIDGVIQQIGTECFFGEISGEIVAQACDSPLRCPGREQEQKMHDLIGRAMAEGDTLGGVVAVLVTGVPAGWGEPVFDKLQADLAKAMLSIGTAKGFEYGLGFNSAGLSGSAYNDPMSSEGFLSNHDGGIQGGISNGQDIFFRVGFKPVPSIGTKQQTVDREGHSREISLTGRHDTCHIPRLVVVVEAMAALVLADHCLRNATARMERLA